MERKDLPFSLDGIEYNADDAVKIWCDDCRGCNKCCENMGDTIVLDPYDINMLCTKLKIAGGGRVTFMLLVSEDGPLELSVNKGVVLPHMKMVETQKEDVGACSFLSPEGRCTIHFCRPGICRLFPLARNYSIEDEVEKMGYFILRPELGCCISDTKPVSIKEWLSIENYASYERFLIDYHGLRKKLQDLSQTDSEKSAAVQKEMLEVFFSKPYPEDFFEEFNNRFKAFMEKYFN